MNEELVILFKEMVWKWMEEEFSPFYADQVRPSVPIRKIAGLLILKQLFNESDESVTARWIENPYWQYFTGEIYFQKRKPFDPTDFVLFHKRGGESEWDRYLVHHYRQQVPAASKAWSEAIALEQPPPHVGQVNEHKWLAYDFSVGYACRGSAPPN